MNKVHILALAVALTASEFHAASVPAAIEQKPQVTEGVVAATPAQLWRVWTTAEGYKQLGAAQCDVDFRVGGLIRSVYDPAAKLGDGSTIENEIMAYEPEHMLAFRIHKTPTGFPFPNAWKRTWSVATLTDRGDGTTLLRVTGLGYDSTSESQHMREFFTAGNAMVLQYLQGAFKKAPAGDASPASVAPASSASSDSDSLAPIVMTTDIALPREQVFDLFATREGWKKLSAQDASIGLRPGGPFEIHFDLSAPKNEQGSEGCTVLSVVPREMLSFSWNAPPKLKFVRTKRTWVVMRFDALSPSSTRVRFTHQGFRELASDFPTHASEFAQTRAYFTQAWAMVLKLAKAQEGQK